MPRTANGGVGTENYGPGALTEYAYSYVSGTGGITALDEGRRRNRNRLIDAYPDWILDRPPQAVCDDSDEACLEGRGTD